MLILLIFIGAQTKIVNKITQWAEVQLGMYYRYRGDETDWIVNSIGAQPITIPWHYKT